jgi:hypothetical protein
MPTAKTCPDGIDHEWIQAWLDAVASGAATMSQRAKTSIESRGGLSFVIEAALAKGVHLVELTDDKGKVLIAASRHPFTALC